MSKPLTTRASTLPCREALEGAEFRVGEFRRVEGFARGSAAAPWSGLCAGRFPRGGAGKRGAEDGQVIVLLVFWLIVITVFLAFIVNAGRVTNERIQVQQAADSAAMSGGVWMARCLNVSALAAVTSTQVMANIALLRSIRPTAEFCLKIAYVYIAVGQAIAAIPIVGPPIGIPIQAYGQAAKIYYSALLKTTKMVDKLTKPPPHRGRGKKGAFWYIVRAMRLTQLAMKLSSLPIVEGASVFGAVGNGAYVGFLIQMKGGLPFPPFAPLSAYGSKQYMREYSNSDELFDEDRTPNPEDHAYGLPGPGTADAAGLGFADGSATYRDGSSTTWGTIFHSSDYPKFTRLFFDDEVYEIIMTGALVFTPLFPHLIYKPFSKGLIDRWYPGEDAPGGSGYVEEDDSPIYVEVEETTASYDELYDAHQKDPNCVVATFWSKVKVLTLRDPSDSSQLPREPFDFGEDLEDVEKYDPDRPNRVSFLDAWNDPDADTPEERADTKNGWYPPPKGSTRFDTDPPPQPDPNGPENPKQTHFREYRRLKRTGGFLGGEESEWNDIFNPADDAMERTDDYRPDNPIYFRRRRKFEVLASSEGKGATWRILPDKGRDGRPIFHPSHEVFRGLCRDRGWTYHDDWRVRWLEAPPGENPRYYRPSPLYEVTDWKFTQGRYKHKKELEDKSEEDGDPNASLDDFKSEMEFSFQDIPWDTLITQGPYAAAIQVATEKLIEPLIEKAVGAFLGQLGPVGELLKLGLQEMGGGEEDPEQTDERRARDNYQKHAPLYFDPEKTGGSAVLQYSAFVALEGQNFSMFPTLFERKRGGLLNRTYLAYACVTVYNATYDSEEAEGLEDCGHLTFAQAWYCRLSPLALQFRSDFKPEALDLVRAALEQVGVTQAGPAFDLLDQVFEQLTQAAEFPLCVFTH